MKTLLIPPITNFDLEQLDKYWRWGGGEVRQIVHPEMRDASLADKQIAIYGPRNFATTLAAQYNVQLLNPDPLLITKMSKEDYTYRDFKIADIGSVGRTDFPAFIRPLAPDVFNARVYHNIQDFKEAVAHLRRKEEILLSPVMGPFKKKSRVFILDGKVADSFSYDYAGHVVFPHRKLFPPAAVMDLGFYHETGVPVVLGIHPAWHAGLKGCAARKVLDCIAAATVN